MRAPWSLAVMAIIAFAAFAQSSAFAPTSLVLLGLSVVAALLRGRVPLPSALTLPLALVLGLVVFANLPELPRRASMIIPSAYAVGQYVEVLILWFLIRRNTYGETLFLLFLALLLAMLAGTTTDPLPYAYLIVVDMWFLCVTLHALMPSAAGRLRPAYLLSWTAALLIAGGLAVFLRYADTTFNLVVSLADAPVNSSRTFAPRSTLSSILNLQGSQRVLARITANVPDTHWVGRVYVRYDKSTWHAVTGKQDVAPRADATMAVAEEGERIFLVGGPDRKPREMERVDLAGDGPGSIFAPRDAAMISARLATLVEDLGGVLFAPNGASFPGRYGVARDPEARDRVAMDAGAMEDALRVPDSVAEYAGPLAREVAGPGRRPTQQALAVETFFHQRFKYGRGYPFRDPRDPLREFLLERPPAHCEFFATGMAMMLRTLGIPTRYATGFVVFERNPVGGYYVVREEHAHAWVEAWIDGQWTRFDPTPPGSLERPSPRWEQLRAWIDLMLFKVGRWKAALTGLSIRELMQKLLAAVLGLGRWLIEQPWRLVILLLLFAAEALFRKQDAPGRRWLRQRAVRRLAGEEPVEPDIREIQALLSRFDEAWRRRGVERPRELTLLEFADRLEHSPGLMESSRALGRAFLQDYGRARYATRLPSRAAIESLEETLRRLEETLARDAAASVGA